MNLKQELENLDQQLKSQLDQIRINWQHRQDEARRNGWPEIPLEQAMDTNGRPLLLDALVARAQVVTALAALPPQTETKYEASPDTAPPPFKCTNPYHETSRCTMVTHVMKQQGV